MTSPSSESTPASSSDGTDLLGNERLTPASDYPSSGSAASAESSGVVTQLCFSDCVTSGKSSSILQGATRDQLEIKLAPTGKRCFLCKRLLPIEAFARMKNRRQPGSEYRNPRCNQCRSAHEKQTSAVRARRDVYDKARSVSCADCKGTFPSVCMDFDHVRGEKKFNIGSKHMHVTMEDLQAEIAKCDVVCSNCRRVRTADRIARGVEPKKGGRPPKFLAELPSDLAEITPGRRSLWRTYRRRV